MNQQTVRQVFGLVVRVLGFWTVLQGLQTLAAGLVSRDDGRAFLLGAMLAILGIGVLWYAGKIVRLTYGPDPTDQQPD